MYNKDEREQYVIDGFALPFDGKLKARNRWVRLSKKIDWEKIEDDYAEYFSQKGKRAIKCRVALGSLIIKELLGLSDTETVEQIRENPYLQYFLGYVRFIDKRPFSPATMHQFRKRFSKELYGKKYIKKLL